MFEAVDDAGLVDLIAAEARANAMADARKYAAIAELARRRDTGKHGRWACDDLDAAAAEVAAALNLGHDRALAEVERPSHCATNSRRWAHCSCSGRSPPAGCG